MQGPERGEGRDAEGREEGKGWWWGRGVGRRREEGEEGRKHIDYVT